MQTGNPIRTTSYKTKTVVIKILCICLLLVPVAGYPSYAAIVIDADTGNVIHEVKANQLWFPASLTKVMTLYLTFKALKFGIIHLQDKLIASIQAENQPKSRLGLKQGDSLTIEQAILAVATRSANDAAVMLAENLATTEKNFAIKMTIRAETLGMDNTRFFNATGLPNDNQVTTARDMAILAQAVLRDFPEYYKYFSIPNFTYKDKTRSNINSLLNVYSGADGIKTGFTCGAGYNLMASVKRNEQRLIAILMGAKNNQARTKKMMGLLDKSFSENGATKVSINIAESRPKSLKPATDQLSAAQCHQNDNSIPKWTIILGSFPTKGEAKQTIKKMKPNMGRYKKYGHPAIIRRMLGGVFLWHALWSGLEKDQAGKTCRILWAAEEQCKVLHPSLYANKNAQWF